MSAHDLVWIEDFILIEGGLPTEAAFQSIEASNARWIVISRHGGTYLYAFTRDELWRWPALVAARERQDNWTAVSFEAVLDLHEEHRSTPAESRTDVPPIDRAWREQVNAPSIDRYIQVAADRTSLAIGVPASSDNRKRAKPPSAPPLHPLDAVAESAGAEPMVEMAPPPSWPISERSAASAAEPVWAEPPPALATEPVLEDEGTTPVRYPSIEADAALTPGRRVTITVDLRHTPAEHTQGGATDLGEQPADWTELTLSVMVSCPRLKLDNEGRGTVTVHRNAASTPASITGTVRQNAVVGETVSVSASFFLGTRFCGSALRGFPITDGVTQSVRPPAEEGPPTRGTIVPQPGAAQPDVTVRISKEGANDLDWLVETRRFDGLPPKLRETVTFDRGVDAEVAELFGRFATLEPGKHVTPLEGFGTRLWGRAPLMFRNAYWALWDHYKRPLTIQFITDEPNLPWELMRPAREDDSEIHQPLALMHPVARWLERFDGYMRNQVPSGGVFTIAPKYATASRRLPRAQTESATLVQHFAAKPVPGTREAVRTLLETSPPAAPVALLHFAGHGTFVRTATTESSITLEDGALTTSEVGRPEVTLGKACRTLVFFNACEVGASGSIFGEVGGWAEAFLSRQFGGFIAPLWSVEDEDAGVVAEELVEGIVTRHEPIGEVLRGLRARHGAVSPTFYSYLYYGDVTARLAP